MFFQAEGGIRGPSVTGVQTCALPIYKQKDEPGEPIKSAEGKLLFEVGTGAQCVQCHMPDRKSVVLGKSVDPGGRRIIKKKINKHSLQLRSFMSNILPP